MRNRYSYLVPVVKVVICLVAATRGMADDGPDFNRDIRPILWDNCVFCHGATHEDEHTELRLDSAEAASADLSGYAAIVPGDPDASELVKRITSTDPQNRMPPPKSHKELKAEQQSLLIAWIAAGAKYEQHWAYLPLRDEAAPAYPDRDWPGNGIDQHVLRAIDGAGFAPSADADPITLARRAAVDLTGIAPTREEVAAYAADPTESAYAQMIERLLASPRYGERMAQFWLDLVRYADSMGYHSDNPIPVAPYRSYVIEAFNANMPYDQFTKEQLAGDLLDSPTKRQLTASAYNRINQKTEEGGAQELEYRAIMQADRVRNVSEAWLGTTLGCAQCHDHKYDPLTARDFYSMGAFFADLDAPDIYNRNNNRGADLTLYSEADEARLPGLKEEIAAAEGEIFREDAQLDAAQEAWEAALTEAAREALPKEAAAALKKAAEKRNEKERDAIRRHYRMRAPTLEAPVARLGELRGELSAIEARSPLVLISRAKEPFDVRLLARGNWMDTTGPLVEPAIPAVFGAIETGNRRATRLDLAEWICSDDNPLTARVFVNRVWQLFFGRGISDSPGDFGGQGNYPANPELLDYLAARFVENGWDVKDLVRHIVMSRTYRQTSKPSPALREADPFNALFARQGRFRLDAEMIRDNALAVAGLLVEQQGGASAHPYQPGGYYAQLNFPKREYQADTGPQQYRRGVYMHWQRTFLHPMLKAFDAPSREECTARRDRSNTPLQSLTLLNDPAFVEAARVFAERILREAEDSPEARVRWAYETVLHRAPDAEIEAALMEVLGAHALHYMSAPEDAAALMAVGQAPAPADLDAVEVAVYASVARVLLNLHETITRY